MSVATSKAITTPSNVAREELVARKATTRFKVTNPRLQILRLLAEYRFLTTHQLHYKTGATSPSQKEQDYRDLRVLRKYEYVRSFACVPERGNNSQHCWLLNLKGARLLEEHTGFKVEYNSHYLRQPSQERLRFRDYELELESQVARAGWQLITPQTYSRSRPLPAKTRQWRVLAQAITRLEASRRVGTVVEEEGPQTLIVPLRTNDYVAHTTAGQERAVVFILSPVKASKRFWQAKAESYRLLARELKVVGVFATEAEAVVYQSLLDSKKLMVTTLEWVGRGLSGL